MTGTHDLIEWEVAAQAHSGEDQSGDLYLIRPQNNRVLVAVIDGLGHGPEAAVASQLAVSTLERYAEHPLVSMITFCHKALRHTRGVVMTLATIDGSKNKLTWLGVGNVEARLVRGANSPGAVEETMLLRNGVVGYDMPSTLSSASLSISAGDILILATDGIRLDFTDKLNISSSAHEMADAILSRHGKGTDDTLVLVAKYLGGELSAQKPKVP